MATDLYEYVPTLRRTVTGPGLGPYAERTDDEYALDLVDGFWIARMDGFFTDRTIVNTTAVDPFLEPQEAPVVNTYAAIRLVRAALVWAETRMKSVAGPVSYEVEHSATLLKQVLDDLTKERDRMRDQALSDEGGSQFGNSDSIDALTVRQRSGTSYAGWGGYGHY